MTETLYSEVKKASEKKGRMFSVNGVLHRLGVSKSGYYAWCKCKTSKSEKRRNELQEEIMKVYEDSNEIYGAPKITAVLKTHGIDITSRTVGKYMHDMGIHAWYRKPYIRTTISVDFSESLKNELNRQFSPDEPDAVWCTDITYIHTEKGFLYLSCIMDLFSRKIVAWELGKTLETTYVISAIKEAIARTGKKPKVIHTDRGVQYTSEEYKKCMEGAVRSYSPKGSPWDNACIESFHALIKREWLWRFRIKDYEHAYKLIFEYIDAFYNTVRVHSHCKYKSPMAYEEEYYFKLKKAERNVA